MSYSPRRLAASDTFDDPMAAASDTFSQRKMARFERDKSGQTRVVAGDVSQITSMTEAEWEAHLLSLGPTDDRASMRLIAFSDPDGNERLVKEVITLSHANGGPHSTEQGLWFDISHELKFRRDHGAPSGTSELAGAFYHQTVTVLGDMLARPRSSTQRNAHGGAALVMAQFAGFSAARDGIGHQFADEVLAVIGFRLSCQLDGAAFIEVGETDEIAITLADSSPEFVGRCVANISTALEAPLTYLGIEIGLVPRLGIALSSIRSTPRTLFRSAYSALRSVRHPQVSAHVFDTTGMEDDDVSRSQLAKISENLEGFIDIWLEPVIEPVRGRIVAYECHPRWNRAPHNAVRTSDLVHNLTPPDLTTRFDQHTVRVSMQYKSLLQFVGQKVDVVVWLSAESLTRPHLLSAIQQILAAHDVLPSSVVVRLDERELTQHHDSVASGITELRDLGMTMSLSNFRATHDAIAHLRNLPITEIQLDPSMTAAPQVDDNAVLAICVEMAQRHKLRTVAAGVASRNDLARLRDLGCDRLSGPLFAAPQPITRVLDDLHSNQIAWERLIEEVR